MRYQFLVLPLFVVGSFTLMSVSCGGELEGCKESRHTLNDAQQTAIVGSSLSGALSAYKSLNVEVRWWSDPEGWTGLKASGETTLTAILTESGNKIEEISASRGTGVITNDPATCASRIEAQYMLSLSTEDGALDVLAPARITVFGPNSVHVHADLPATDLVGPGVNLSWNEQVENGLRTGYLTASTNEPLKNISSGKVQAIAQWELPVTP
jgi:hypothetical protein